MRIFGAIHGLGRRQQEKVTAAALERCETPQQLIVAISYTLSRFLQPHPASGYASPAMVAARLPDPVTPHPKRGLDFVRLAVSAREGW